MKNGVLIQASALQGDRLPLQPHFGMEALAVLQTHWSL